MLMKPLSTMQLRNGRGGQAGVLLLEALLAILIFSIGILAIVAMEARAVQDVSESKYRSDAAFLANQIVADMWGNSANLASYAYGGSGAAPALLTNWMSTIQARLPGVNVASGTNLPKITMGANNMVTVQVRWQQARDTGAPAHSYTLTAYINCCL
jgi:type IV pilus assembly protein PilV